MSGSHDVPCRSTVVFRESYTADQEELRKLYENAKRDQWNPTTDLRWEQPVEPDQGVIADELVDAFGTRYWTRLSERDRAALNRRVAAWRLGTLMYGEHGAMLVCSQLVEMVTGGDAKLFQATQVVDEARHTEVLSRYLEEKLEARPYPMPLAEKELFDTLLGDSRWPVKTIGLQLVAETFAVSLFRMLAETSKEPLLREICRRILADEARHMGFGMLSLPAVVAGSTESERRELEEVTEWALVKVLKGLFPYDAYREAGFEDAEIEDIRRLKRERRAGGEALLFRQVFRKELDSALLQNLGRIGLLNEGCRARLAAIGIHAPRPA